VLLLRVDTADGPLVQGFVRVRWPAGDRLIAGQVAAWARLFVRSALLWSQVRPLSAALRLSVRPGEPLSSVHSFVVPKSQEARLRLLLAAFLRTTGMSGAEADVPQSEADLPGRFVHPGDTRLSLQHEALSSGGGLRIHVNLRLADRLPRLMQTLADFGVPVAYELQVAPWSPPRELLRTVLYDVARLADAGGVPEELAADQKALADRLRRAAQQRPAYHVEECLATAPELTEPLGETVGNLLAETLYGSLGAAPPLAPLAPPQAEAFAYHVHSHAMHGPPDAPGPESVAAAAVKDEIDRLLSCRALIPDGGAIQPAGGAEPLFTVLSGPPPTPAGGAPRPAQPAAGGGGQPYLFISYARKDGELVYPLLDALGRSGVSMWIDRRLLGGEDWVAELEQHLIHCNGVLALISPSFVESKYCAREVHFADALDRPILPISLAAGVDLQHGLRFLLNTTQIVDFHATNSIEAIIASIRRHAPASMPGGGLGRA